MKLLRLLFVGAACGALSLVAGCSDDDDTVAGHNIVLTPTSAPPGAAYVGGQTVTIASGTAGVTIRYTMDGSTPTETSPTYTTPVTIAATSTLKAKAWKSGMTPSDVAVEEYVIGQVAPPVPAGQNVVLRWDAALLKAIRDVRPGPPQTARAIAITHTCMYDAWSAYDAVAVPTRNLGDIRRPAEERTDGFKSKAISYAAFRALSDLFPAAAQVGEFRALMTELGYDPNDSSRDKTTPSGIGSACADAVTTFRHGDGSNQLGDIPPGTARYSDYTGYVARNPAIDMEVPTPLSMIPAPDRWQPLTYPLSPGATPVTPPYAGPHWGNVIPFALTHSAQFRPAPPAALGTEAFRNQCLEVLDYSANLTDERKVIAEYWADGPGTVQPPGHWCAISRFVSLRDGHTLDQDVKLFFAVGNALMDAGIACWEAKRFYDYARPVTAIRYLFNGQTISAWGGPGQGTKEIDGAAWHTYQTPYFPTPPFPEYTSGHSAFSAASAEILRRFTGNDNYGDQVTILRGTLTVEPGFAPSQDITLSWGTFTEAAEQAGISRLYGGIHFSDANVNSRRMGLQVGAVVWTRASSYWNGTATTGGSAEVVGH